MNITRAEVATPQDLTWTTVIQTVTLTVFTLVLVVLRKYLTVRLFFH